MSGGDIKEFNTAGWARVTLRMNEITAVGPTCCLEFDTEMGLSLGARY